MKKYLPYIIIFLVILLFGSGYYFYSIQNSQDIDQNECLCEKEEEKEETKEEIANVVKINVDIKGAVKKPGVYTIDENNIINDVIKLAGGFKSNAYKNNLNLSKKVINEMVIYVFTKYEFSKLNKGITQNTCSSNYDNVTNCLNEGNSMITNTNEKTSSENNDNKININTADKKTLTNLTGVGEAKAENIISYRNQNNGFKNIEDLKNVTGIGEAIYEQIKNHITV